MFAGVRAIAAALAMVSVSFAAVAQVVPPGAQIVPPSDQPGRERERFERPPVPLAQPGGPAISVPGIEAPVIDVATGRPLKSLVVNDGKIRANGGRVELTAAAARVVVDSVINTSGVIKANSIGRHNGMIVLSAATGTSKPQGAPTQTIKISGTLSAAGKKKGTQGGTILVSGEDIKLASARVDASGRAGGGKVLIGGDWGGGNPNTSLVANPSAKLESFLIPTATTVSVDAGTTINASATGRGNGGKIILWSDSETTFAGTILARGGARSGDGGFVETSSHGQLNYSGTTDTRAPRGATGTLLLDPYDVSISNSRTSNGSINGGTFTPNGDSSVLNANDLAKALALSNIIVTTGGAGSPGLQAGNITVERAVTVIWSADTKLTLSAYSDINFQPGAVIQNTGNGTLVLQADKSGTGSGKVSFQSDSRNCETCLAPGRVDFSQSTGTVSIFYNPMPLQTSGNKYENPTSYLCSGSCSTGGVLAQASQLTAYMLVNTPSDLQIVSTSARRPDAYALGRDIDASNFAPLGSATTPLNTIFDGQGHTISNLKIAPNDASTNNIGLFAAVGSAGTIRDLNLTNVSVNANPGVTSQWVGTLAGTNAGTISNVSASGQVNGGTIVNVGLGGLVGFNSPGATITGSSATATVTSTASVIQNGPDCSASNSCQNVSAGGLVGQNFGSIADSSAGGNVSVGSNGTGGGLVGFNSGIIENAFASGNVTGAAGSKGINGQGGSTTLGGLAGVNQGLISDSSASGNVGSPSVANLQAGGLVGDNAGAIFSSSATGNVQAGSASIAGGLVASNSPFNNFNCISCLNGDGSFYFNSALIVGSQASGNVGVGAGSIAGGFAGSGDGIIALSSATGAVTGGGNGILGGFIGALTNDSPGLIIFSTSSGPVASTGPNSIVGGFAGLNGGTIWFSSSSSPVTGTSESYLGGFAGVNLGTIQYATALAPVTGTGNHDIIGGFVGANFGSIDSSASAGNASGSTNSAVGGFAGTNARFINFAAGSIPDSSFPLGTITNSTATGAATGGQGSTVDPFIAVNDPTSASNPPAFPSIIAGCSDPLCGFLNTGILPPPGAAPQLLPPFSPEFLASLPGPVQVINNLVGNGPAQLAALDTAPVVNIPPGGGVGLPPQPPPTPTPGAGNLPPGFDRRIIDIPPLSLTSLVKDEVVVQIATNNLERLQAGVRTLGLTLIASENLAITGSTAVRFRITDGRTPQDIIRALAAIQLVAVAQPNYIYTLQQQPDDAAPASRGDSGPKGDAAQYILEKLKMSDVHRMVRGANVPIAVIDSEIDATHPDLEGVIAQRFSAIGAAEKPHAHGTGMAGAIASHQRLLGTAPAARLLAVHAFSAAGANPESTTFNILKGIDWSVRQGARIINMSFAGPKDPSLERALKAAYDKGIVLIAAAGNAGPKSPPLFPGADPYVIAVTATDVDDKLYAGANRGKYISVAAPGVDILVPAPEGDYQLTTGTSVAAAEVSGIVALLLERNPKLRPADIRRILTASAKRLGSGERDDNFGSGLIDPLQALQLADPRTATTTPPPRQR
jgi:hypothetical protein